MYQTPQKKDNIGRIFARDNPLQKSPASQNEYSLLKNTGLHGLHSSSQLFHPRTSRYVKDPEVMMLHHKFNKMSHSFDFTFPHKNRLNLIQYQMQGERSRHDPQMILAKLRKLENKAELYRADYELINQNMERPRVKNQFSQHHQSNILIKKQKAQSYLKIYQSYKKQKQQQVHKFVDEDEENIKENELQIPTINNGIKYFSSLIKHPKILDYTIHKMKMKGGAIQKQKQTLRKTSLSKRIQQQSSNEQYFEQKKIEKVKDQMNKIQNPEKIIQRQITKFYVKKNPGKLTEEALLNSRSQDLIHKQNQISFRIDASKISKQYRKNMRYRFNDLANQIAKSDRKRSTDRKLSISK